MRVAVVGAGGVGGFFGGRLAAAGHDVAFVARGAHLAALRDRGLKVVSIDGDFELPHVRATDRPADIGAVDVVLFTVKLYDAAAAAQTIGPLIGADTIVIPLQNGVDASDLVAAAVGRDHTGGGTTYIGAVITEPGVINHNALGRIIFGELDGRRSPRLERLLAACTAANIRAALSEQIDVDVWTKFVRLSVFSGMTALTRSSIGPIVSDPDLFAMLKDAVAEAMAVARAKGVAVPGKIGEDLEQSYVALPPHMRSSLLDDLERGRRLELPWLSGAIVRLGRELGVPTPVHHFITLALKLHVNGAVA